jgi:beta-galactosidase/beta-glucuronidase
VPFTFESALSGIGKGAEVHERVWYRRTFNVPRSWRDRLILLNFNACDWETTVWVNGHHVGTHRGGYTGFSFDITEALVSGAREKEVVVAVYDPAHPDRSRR